MDGFRINRENTFSPRKIECPIWPHFKISSIWLFSNQLNFLQGCSTRQALQHDRFDSNFYTRDEARIEGTKRLAIPKPPKSNLVHVCSRFRSCSVEPGPWMNLSHSWIICCIRFLVFLGVFIVLPINATGWLVVEPNKLLQNSHSNHIAHSKHIKIIDDPAKQLTVEEMLGQGFIRHKLCN